MNAEDNENSNWKAVSRLLHEIDGKTSEIIKTYDCHYCVKCSQLHLTLVQKRAAKAGDI